MNKAELIDVISAKVGVSKKETEDVVDTMVDTIIAKLKDGDEVTLTGFGAFSARTRKGRIGVNPRNPAEKIDIPSVVVPKFKAGKNLKEALKVKSSGEQPKKEVIEEAPEVTE
jgi:DNA-binding protein HU-beta